MNWGAVKYNYANNDKLKIGLTRSCTTGWHNRNQLCILNIQNTNGTEGPHYCRLFKKKIVRMHMWCLDMYIKLMNV